MPAQPKFAESLTKVATGAQAQTIETIRSPAPLARIVAQSKSVRIIDYFRARRRWSLEDWFWEVFAALENGARQHRHMKPIAFLVFNAPGLALAALGVRIGLIGHQARDAVGITFALGLALYMGGGYLMRNAALGGLIRVLPGIACFVYFGSDFINRLWTGNGDGEALAADFLAVCLALSVAVLTSLPLRVLIEEAQESNESSNYESRAAAAPVSTLAHSLFTEATPPRVSDPEI